MSKLLEGIRVLDFTQFLAGPYCGMFLADMGAEVIKIENLKGGGDFTRTARPHVNNVSMYFCNVNRNKRSIALDLKTEGGKELFEKLVQSADVLLENNRPGVMGRLGFAYEDCKKINPALIYASISGFGQYGPHSSRPGYDLIAQAMGGSMSVTGWPGEEPTRTGIPLADVLAGLNACIGILASLYKRVETGKGQNIDVALVDSIVSSLETQFPPFLQGGKIPGRTGNRYLAAAPYDSYKAKDTGYVMACGTQPHFVWLCDVMGKPELLEDARFATVPDRNIHWAPLKEIINEWSADKTAEEIVDLLLKARVPAAPIYDFKDVYEDEHIAKTREMFVKVVHPEAGEVEIVGNPLKMSDYPLEYKASPALGEAADEVLGKLGLSTEELKKYRDTGALL